MFTVFLQKINSFLIDALKETKHEIKLTFLIQNKTK